MMKKQPIAFGTEDSGTPLGTVPAVYVLMKQLQITGKADQGDLVTNQEDNGLASNIAAPVKSKVKTCLPADCTSGSITVTLDNNNMWNEFYYRSTEMILTKQGRRMFPYCRYWITGLDSKLKYILVVDISPVDNLRYKWNGHSWEPSGKAEPHVLGRVFIHPESPSTGCYWMHQPVSFYKLKLTNNTLDQEGHIILHSMHRYLPRLHLVPADKVTDIIQLNGPDVHTFIFPQTEFFAVTAYQNIQITQLKIDYNPFLKGFKKAALSSTLEHKAKQNDYPEQERCRVANFTSCYSYLAEEDVSDTKQRDLDASCNAWKMYKSSLEKKTLTPDTECDTPVLKQDASECPTTCESDSRVRSQLHSNYDFGISIKDEPVDDYAYGPRVHTERILMTQEDTDKATEKYFCRDNKIPEKQLENNSDEMGRREVDTESHKRPPSVGKPKTLKFGNQTVPGASIKCCGAPKNVTISALQAVLSSYKTEKPSSNHSVNSLPVCFENNKLSSPLKVMEAKHEDLHFRSNNTEKGYLGKDVPWRNIESHTVTKKAMSLNPLLPTSTKFIHGRKEKNVVKKVVLGKDVDKEAGDMLLGSIRRGRPCKVKLSEVQPSLKFTAKSTMTSNVGPDFAMAELMLDYEDVDGFLFASFTSKEVLDKHIIDEIGGRGGLQNREAYFVTAYDSDSEINLQVLETKLLEDLKSFRHRQVIHPNLQEVGLKLGSVDPASSIDLKYLGVQLPLRPSKDYVVEENQVTDLSSQDTALSFISKTGKTNDFRKIKGWQGRLHGASKQEGSILENSLKNQSAFCSEKLDKYLEKEGKLMESVGFSSSLFSYSTDCQTPSKGTSCVQGPDKAPEKKPIITPSRIYASKPLSVPSFFRRRRKAKNKQTTFRGRVKSSQKFMVPLPVLSKQEQDFSALENICRPRSHSQVTDEEHVPELDGSLQRKQKTVHQAQQRKQSNYPLHLSQMKLMELEDCALRDGKPQTCITEEWADLSLEPLIISQVLVELMELEGRALQNGKPRTCISKERADLSLASLLSPQVQNTNWKEECSSIKPDEKIPHVKKVEAKEAEITIYNTKLKENKLPAFSSELHSESIIHENSFSASEMAKKNAEIAERLSSDALIFHRDTVSLDHTYSITAVYKKEHHVNCPEEAPGDMSQLNGRDSSQGDVKTFTEPGVFSKKSIISHLDTTAAHALLPRQLHLVHDSSNKVMAKSLKQSRIWNREPKNRTPSMTYRPTHTADEQRRRKQIKELFEKLQGALGFHSTPTVAKRILLEQATEDIQRLKDQAEQLASHKKFLLCKRNTLIGKLSALSGKPQEAILKKLEYIFTKQKALEEQENQNQKEMMEIIKTVRTASSNVENSPFSLSREMKPVMLSSKHTKPFICSKKRSSITEPEDSLMMPRIVNVMSLATEENTKEIQIANVVALAAEENANLVLDLNQKPFVILDTDSQKRLPSMQIVLQETTGFQSEGNAEPSFRKQRDATGATQVFLREKENCFPQIVNVSNMKGSPELFATKLFIEELNGNWLQIYRGGEGQKTKDSSFQKLQINKPKDSGVVMELQKVASAVPEPALGSSDLMDRKNDGIDDTLTSLLNEIICLNQQLNDAAPDRSKLHNSPNTELSLEGLGKCTESAAAGFQFQFGKLGESCKDLCFVQENSGSVTPLLLHLEEEDLTDGDRNLRDPSSESDIFNLMPDSDVMFSNDNISTTSGRSWRNAPCMTKTTNVSLPVLQMKTNQEPGHIDTQWKPMPKLAPFGLKGASFLLDSGRQNTRIIPLLAPVGADLSSVDLKATLSAVKDRSIK